MDPADAGEEQEELQRLRHEEQSLRNLAALLAAPGPSDDILTALCREISEQLDGQEVSLLRFNPEEYAVVATHRGPIPIGVRAPRTSGSLPERVAHTGGPVRVDDFDDQPDADLVRPFGIRAAVGVPVFVEGAVWGMFSATSQSGPLPARTESRLAGFAELTWAAVANAQARETLGRLAEEQAALRYIAELVARESPLPTVFQAAVESAARLHSALVELSQHIDGGRVGETVVVRAGHPPETASLTAEAPVQINGARWGTLRVIWPAALGPIGADRPKAFTDLIAAAIANAHHREGLTRSRARIIAAADEARRRLQRDVHDGAQQRLVHTIITLKLARDAAAAGQDVTDLVAEALTNAEEANRELRDIVRGILPASLTRAGLTAGIRALVAEVSVPVALDIDVPRLPAAVETTGYFTVAEAITNAVKHARATRIQVIGALSDVEEELVLAVEDDGIGGVDPAKGTGLIGLADRIEARGGTLTVTSTPAGTRVTARIPVVSR